MEEVRDTIEMCRFTFVIEDIRAINATNYREELENLYYIIDIAGNCPYPPEDISFIPKGYAGPNAYYQGREPLLRFDLGREEYMRINKPEDLEYKLETAIKSNPYYKDK